jgi:hypothetical protein
MAVVLLNGDVTGVEYAAMTWGELLEVLDEQRNASGDLVTGVRLDGKDVPAFRTPHALSRPLSAGAEVCIDTTSPADLINQTLDDAETATLALVEGAAALAALYRGPDVSAANRTLPELGESLGTLIVITNTVAHGAGVDLSAVGDGRLSANQMITNLIAHADVLLVAQRADNWAQVADVIDEIATTLRRWPQVLQAIRQAVPALTNVA